MAHSTGAGPRDLPVRKGGILLSRQSGHVGPSQHSTHVEGEHSPTWVSNFWCPTEPLERVGLGLSASILDPSRPCSNRTSSLYCLSLPPSSLTNIGPPFPTVSEYASPSSLHCPLLPPILHLAHHSLFRAVFLSSRHSWSSTHAVLTRPTSAEPLLSLVQFWSPNPVDILKIYLDGPPHCI